MNFPVTFLVLFLLPFEELCRVIESELCIVIFNVIVRQQFIEFFDL